MYQTMKKTGNVIIGFTVLIVIWQSVIMLTDINENLFPTPLMVLEGLISLIADGTLWTHIRVSLIRFAIGYSLATVSAIVLGLILGRLERLWEIANPIVQVLRPVAPIAWSPFIVLWFGIGDIPAIVIIFIAAFFPVLLSTVSAVRKVERTYLKVAENFEMNPFQVMTKIILPAAFPLIANGMHIALGTAWIFLVSGEMVGAQSGLGYLIVDARNLLRLDLVLAGIVCIGVLGLILDKAITAFERWLQKQWGGAAPSK